MSTYRIMPRSSIRISDLKDPQMEQLARAYDSGGKGYLTVNEAFSLFADKNGDIQPGSIDEVLKFLGGPQHKMTVHHLDGYEVLAMPYNIHDWKGDFHVDGLGAGNVRVGGYYNWERPNDPRTTVVLIDCNLMDIAVLEKQVISATLVVGPQGFKPEPGSQLPEEAVELPLTMATEDAHMSWTRSGNSWVPEKKFLAAAVAVEDLRALGGAGGLDFYVRLETVNGTKYVNRDGVPGENFRITDDELKTYGGA
jgi:hypothetical protein